MHPEALSRIAVENLPLFEEMYENFQKNPSSVSASWRQLFRQMEEDRTAPLAIEERPPPIYIPQAPDDLRIFHLIDAYRSYGHLLAKVNPLSSQPPQRPRELTLAHLGFQESEKKKTFPTCGFLPQEEAPLEEILAALEKIYCGSIGFEYREIHHPELEQWLQKQIEPSLLQISLSIEEKQLILQQLNKSELLESFIHRKYTGQKRFSLEGAETLIPMLSALLDEGGHQGIEEAVLGMAHRGRLNVLANILNKAYQDIFAEFEEGYVPPSYEGSGDVKYHKGWLAEIKTARGYPMKIVLAPNPSHLESVDPIVEGQSKGRQNILQDSLAVLPILIHGDAALSGQGVVYETMQLCNLDHYRTGGTIHFVINNQIGFTTLPQEARSTYYCTDIAKAFGAPVFHVNAEDPEGCVYATLLAAQIRQRFQRDVFLDLHCYRKYGHNETDEPAFTQPLEYRVIRKKKPIREIYRDQLIHEGVVEKYLAEGLEAEFKEALQLAIQRSREKIGAPPTTGEIEEEKKIDPAFFQEVSTAVTESLLEEVAEKISKIPKNFHLHSKLARLVDQRWNMVRSGEPLDWGMAELLSYGTILWEGTPIRLAGQDTRRGTFSHRHALWVDQDSEEKYIPLQHLREEQGRFEVINTPLSEFAALGFEYGYTLAIPSALVIWEAQFGDFSNGAQVLIDQYLISGEHKWGQASRLTLFLPHGYEGQGPEHSSARIERFLSLAAHGNIRLVNPTTPAQFFHLLRLQVKSPLIKPLVVFTPKELLRHPHSVSSLGELCRGGFQTILEDPEVQKEAKVLVFCSGRIYYDLRAEREKRDAREFALLRLEQLYPLDARRIVKLIEECKECKTVLWAQEEPENMGAWGFLSLRLRKMVPEKIHVEGVMRPRSASPATGAHAYHQFEKETLMDLVFKRSNGNTAFSIPHSFKA